MLIRKDMPLKIQQLVFPLVTLAHMHELNLPKTEGCILLPKQVKFYLEQNPLTAKLQMLTQRTREWREETECAEYEHKMFKESFLFPLIQMTPSHTKYFREDMVKLDNKCITTFGNKMKGNIQVESLQSQNFVSRRSKKLKKKKKMIALQYNATQVNKQLH